MPSGYSPGSTTSDILQAYSYPPSPSTSSLRSPQPRDTIESWNLTSSVSDLPMEHNECIPSSAGSKGNESRSKTHIWHGWRFVVFGSWFNFLLLLIPVSWTLSFVLGKHHKVIFIFSILSMIPLVKLHDLSTRELALRIGGTKAGLLNATMSNTVELVVAITALRKCELRVVQSSLIGSILSKLLLVLGICFFAGGLRFSEQVFDQTATQIHSSLLSISVGALLLPAAYHFSITGGKDSGSYDQQKDILKMSYGVSIILMFIYIAYLLFQFWSHKHLYKDTKQNSDKLSVKLPVNPRYLTQKFSASINDKSGSIYNGQTSRSSSLRGSTVSSFFSPLPIFSCRSSPLTPSEITLTSSTENLIDTNSKGSIRHSSLLLAKLSQQTAKLQENDYGDGSTIARFQPPWSPSTIDMDMGTRSASPEAMTTSDDLALHGSPSGVEIFREPRVSWLVAILLLTLVTVTVSIIAEDLVESMDDISMTISKQWVGLILLPAVSSIAECVTAVNVSVKDQLTLSISVAVGSSIQTTLLIIPFMVTLGWIMNRPLALLFDPFESVVLYISVQTMSYVVADGKSNWLEGTILICLYFIIAVSFWFYPAASNYLPSELCGT